MKESIFKSALRSFMVATFTIFGIIFALFVLGAAIAIFSEVKTGELDPENSVVILPNLDGKREELKDDVPLILQLDIEGIIGMDDLSRSTIRTQLRESRIGDLADDRVKGLMLKINSPGGTVLDSSEIYAAVKAYKKKYNVPVYAYVEGLCASGGMYIACSADKIYTTDGSIIGSVGVLLPTVMNFSELLKSVGVESKTITSGKDKDPLNPFRPWKEGEAQILQDITDSFYRQFIDVVVSSRPELSREKLIQDYGARVFPAAEAQEFGYVDDAQADYEIAMRALLTASGVSEEDEYQIVRLEDENWMKKILTGVNAMCNGTVKHQIQLSGDLRPELQHQVLYLYRPEW